MFLCSCVCLCVWVQSLWCLRCGFLGGRRRLSGRPRGLQCLSQFAAMVDRRGVGSEAGAVACGAVWGRLELGQSQWCRSTAQRFRYKRRQGLRDQTHGQPAFVVRCSATMGLELTSVWCTVACPVLVVSAACDGAGPRGPPLMLKARAANGRKYIIQVDAQCIKCSAVVVQLPGCVLLAR